MQSKYDPRELALPEHSGGIEQPSPLEPTVPEKHGYANQVQGNPIEICDLPIVPDQPMSSDVSAARADFIIRYRKKWANGTRLHYYLYSDQAIGSKVPEDDPRGQWRTWAGDRAQQDEVRRAFQIWKDVGIGLEFIEVDRPDDAEFRIGFQRGAGSWSYIGRDALGISLNDRTMNFGWDLTSPWGQETSLHEIGHALGLPHEHQNPHAGIEWIPEAVYRAFSNWPRHKVDHNILNKIAANQVQGSDWDQNSIMHYPFDPGLIRNEPYFSEGINPRPGLSADDIAWIRHFYPAQEPEPAYLLLEPYTSKLFTLENGQQENFSLQPNQSRDYTIQTFGQADTVMVLFEMVDGVPRYRAGNDNSGTGDNAKIEIRLESGREYIIRIRSYYSERPHYIAVMYW